MKSLLWLVLSLSLFLPCFGFAKEDMTPTPTISSTPGSESSRMSAWTYYKAWNNWSDLDPFAFTAALFHASVKGGMEYELGGGLVLFSSDQLSRGYWGYALSCLIGFKLTDLFSLSFGVDGAGFKNSNSALTGGVDFNEANLVLLGKYRLATGDVRPYLFFGPGLAMNGHFLKGMAYDDPNRREDDFMLEGGFGVELRMDSDLFLLVQTGVTYDYLSDHFANYSYADAPSSYIPFQIGLIIEK